MIDLAREMLAAQSHRRTIDPITFAKRVRPFVIERAAYQAAVGHPAASDPRPANQAHQVGTDDRAENNHAG